MYIARVRLENIRSFPNLDFDLHRPGGAGYAGWTVVTGDNAAGKSTLLRAIALALLGPDQSRALGVPLEGWVRRGAALGRIGVELVPGPHDLFAGGGARPKTFWAELELRQEGTEVFLRPGELYGRKQKGAANGPWRPGSAGWLSVGYGPFRRLRGSHPDAARLMALAGRAARFGTMFREDATLGESVQWLRDLQYKALEGGAAAKVAVEAAKRLLNDEFLRNDLVLNRLDSSGVWLRDQAGVEVSLEDMSDGYRSSLAMLTDLLRQVEASFGADGLLDEQEGRLVVPHEGVVLVDEVDAHLHPGWQRDIGFWLKRRFPAIQFIVTTHSPLIVQASDPGGLYALPPPGHGARPAQVPEPERARLVASQPNDILLSPAFGLAETRSPEAVAARREHARLKAKAQAGVATPEDRARQEQLRLFAETDNDA